MKRILTIALLLISIQAFSQNYKLFKPDSRKVYAQLPALDSTFNIKFDSVSFNGIDSVYHFYKDVGNDWMVGEGCQFGWGFEDCVKQNKPKWLGDKILFNESHSYKFITNANDTLFLNFPLLQGSSITFFEDTLQRFSITYEGRDTLTLIGITDTVQKYRINHFNLFGDTIQSPLNNHRIIVGNTLGLIQFFLVDKFPGTLKPLRLIGNTSPNAGLYQITQAMANDFQVGDEYQRYKYSFSSSQGHTEYNGEYTKYTIIERFDTPDSIIYTAIRNKFNYDYTNYINDTINLSYSKNVVLISIPFDNIFYSEFHCFRSLYKATYCDLSLWTYKMTLDLRLYYCESQNCWGGMDCFGPCPDDILIYVIGLGLYKDYYYKWYPGPENTSHGYGEYIVYFVKNGISCGDEIIVGQSEFREPEISLNISPNPALNSITITVSENTSGQITFYNLEGQELVHFDMKEQKINIDVTNLKSGVYILKYSGNNFIKTAKFIKQ